MYYKDGFHEYMMKGGYRMITSRKGCLHIDHACPEENLHSWFWWYMMIVTSRKGFLHTHHDCPDEGSGGGGRGHIKFTQNVYIKQGVLPLLFPPCPFKSCLDSPFHAQLTRLHFYPFLLVSTLITSLPNCKNIPLILLLKIFKFCNFLKHENGFAQLTLLYPCGPCYQWAKIFTNNHNMVINSSTFKLAFQYCMYT